MAKSNPIDVRLKTIAALETASDSEAVRSELRRGLNDASNLVVGKAAQIIRQLELAEFISDLRIVWPRYLEEPVDRDKGCVAKTAIVEALGQLGFDEPDFYLEGLRYRQLEPAWGKPNDTAINLRGACAFALTRSRMIGLNDKLIALTELLADSERLARVHAVNAIADLGHESVVPLLRVKAACGDTEADVIGACLSSLLKLAPRESVSFVARFLSSPNEPIVLEAAAALGESGLPEAINLLVASCQRTTDRDVLESFLVSLGLSRQPLAIEFLISRLNPVTSSSEPALKALAPSRFYPDIYRRVQAAVEASGNRRLQALFQEAFGDK